MSISGRIHKRRKELGLTQSEVAKRAGLHPPAISQYESGSRNPSYEALIKLASALNVSTEYLMSGVERGQEEFLDRKSEIIMKIVNSLSPNDKDKTLEYVTFLASGNKIELESIFSNPIDYADSLLKKYTNGNVPVDVFSIAEELNINIMDGTLNDTEGLLLKADQKIILLNHKKTHKQRRKFTIATLIGHSVIPWHLKTSYNVRKTGTSTLLSEEVEEMEAHQFASNLIMPSNSLKQDLMNLEISLRNLEDLAYEKYDVSLFTLAIRLVDYASDKYVLVQSENNKVIKPFGKREIKIEVDKRSFAGSLFKQPTSIKTTHTGVVPAKYWFLDAKPDEEVYEESVYNPELGRVLTLITILKN